MTVWEAWSPRYNERYNKAYQKRCVTDATTQSRCPAPLQYATTHNTLQRYNATTRYTLQHATFPLRIGSTFETTTVLKNFYSTPISNGAYLLKAL